MRAPDNACSTKCQGLNRGLSGEEQLDPTLSDQPICAFKSARLRLLRLSEAAENLLRRAAMDVQNGKEDEARDLLVQKKKVVRAMDRSKFRIQLLDELSLKIDEAIALKESESINNLNRMEFRSETSDQLVHIMSTSQTPMQEDLRGAGLEPSKEEDSSRNAEINEVHEEYHVLDSSFPNGIHLEEGSNTVDLISSSPILEASVEELRENGPVTSLSSQNKISEEDDSGRNARTDVVEENEKNPVQNSSSPRGISLEEGSFSCEVISSSPITEASVKELLEEEWLTSLSSQNKISEEDDSMRNIRTDVTPISLAESSCEENEENPVHNPASPRELWLEEDSYSTELISSSPTIEASDEELHEKRRVCNLSDPNEDSDEEDSYQSKISEVSPALEISEEDFNVGNLIGSGFIEEAEGSFLKGISSLDELMQSIDRRLQEIEGDLGLILRSSTSMIGEDLKAEHVFEVLGDIQRTRKRIASIIKTKSEESLLDQSSKEKPTEQENVHPHN
ncbi:forkhead-associated domain protein isoform X2 [Wolffia australiana]